MLFSRLLESQRAAVATQAMLEGAGVSALVHGLLIGGYLYVTRDLQHVRPEPDASFTPVQWLVPKDRIPGRPQRETVTWTALSGRAGEGFAEDARQQQRDEARVEVVIPEGKKNDTDVAPKQELAQAPIALGDSIMTE